MLSAAVTRHVDLTWLCKMDFSVESLYAMEKEFSSEMAKVLKMAKVKSTTELNDSVLMNLTKKPLADIIMRLANLCEKNLNICKSAASNLDEMKTAQIESQKNCWRFSRRELILFSKQSKLNLRAGQTS